jgi:hypothetical protein
VIFIPLTVVKSLSYGCFKRTLLRMAEQRGPFEKFVDCRKCAAVMQREAVTIRPSCSGRGNVVLE